MKKRGIHKRRKIGGIRKNTVRSRKTGGKPGQALLIQQKLDRHKDQEASSKRYGVRGDLKKKQTGRIELTYGRGSLRKRGVNGRPGTRPEEKVQVKTDKCKKKKVGNSRILLTMRIISKKKRLNGWEAKKKMGKDAWSGNVLVKSS